VGIVKHGIPPMRLRKLRSMGEEYFKKIKELIRRLNKIK
jgi:hypothetical protein